MQGRRRLQPSATNCPRLPHAWRVLLPWRGMSRCPVPRGPGCLVPPAGRRAVRGLCASESPSCLRPIPACGVVRVRPRGAAFVSSSVLRSFRRPRAAGFHLFPFRTEQLSPRTPMVLRKRESRSPPFFSGRDFPSGESLPFFSASLPAFLSPVPLPVLSLQPCLPAPACDFCREAVTHTPDLPGYSLRLGGVMHATFPICTSTHTLSLPLRGTPPESGRGFAARKHCRYGPERMRIRPVKSAYAAQAAARGPDGFSEQALFHRARAGCVCCRAGKMPCSSRRFPCCPHCLPCCSLRASPLGHDQIAGGIFSSYCYTIL